MSKTKLIALLGGLGCVLAAAVICLVVLLTGDAGKVQPAGSSDVTADSAPEAPAPESPGSEEEKPVERPLTGDPGDVYRTFQGTQRRPYALFLVEQHGGGGLRGYWNCGESEFFRGRRLR